jgi:YfiH family protein
VRGPAPGTGAADPWLRPAWSAPVGALMSTRLGGVSAPPWDRLNLGTAVGDEPAAVAENRRRLAAAAGVPIVWLRQVHGPRVLQRGAADVGQEPAEADAAWTDEPGVALAVQVADCLPVLLAAPDGRAVAAAHAGWRGLAGGVLDRTVAALCQAAGCAPGALHAWLGPCIGPEAFEVGADVLRAFDRPTEPLDDRADPPRFRWRPRADGDPRWRADLAGLAADRLRALGLTLVAGGGWCTVSEPSRFFSFRRDGVTGRMAAIVWRRG